ncbi:MAG TPA: hypothetical protein VFM55_13110 [Micromonosporaceae bacterium]|nr:hypothetical protein [Micromonosporaceae bacterium]
MTLRMLGTLVGVAAAMVTAVLEAFLTPLWWLGVRIPLAVLLAVLTNLAVLWFTHEVTRSRVLTLLPGIAWMGVMIVLSARTTEGDIVLADNWVALSTILAGVAGYAAGAYRIVTRPPATGTGLAGHAGPGGPAPAGPPPEPAGPPGPVQVMRRAAPQPPHLS